MLAARQEGSAGLQQTRAGPAGARRWVTGSQPPQPGVGLRALRTRPCVHPVCALCTARKPGQPLGASAARNEGSGARRPALGRSAARTGMRAAATQRSGARHESSPPEGLPPHPTPPRARTAAPQRRRCAPCWAPAAARPPSASARPTAAWPGSRRPAGASPGEGRLHEDASQVAALPPPPTPTPSSTHPSRSRERPLIERPPPTLQDATPAAASAEALSSSSRISRLLCWATPSGGLHTASRAGGGVSTPAAGGRASVARTGAKHLTSRGRPAGGHRLD